MSHKTREEQEKALLERVQNYLDIIPVDFWFEGLCSSSNKWTVHKSLYSYSVCGKTYNNKSFNYMNNEFIRVFKQKGIDIRVKNQNQSGGIEYSKIEISLSCSSKVNSFDKFDRYYVAVFLHKKSNTLFLKQGKFSSSSNSNRLCQIDEKFNSKEFTMWPPFVLETKYASKFEETINDCIAYERKRLKTNGEPSLSERISIYEFEDEKVDISFIPILCNEARKFKHFSSDEKRIIEKLRSFL